MDDEQRRLAEEMLASEKKTLNFAKGLFFGAFESSLAFPFPSPTPEKLKETQEFVAKVKRFAEQEIDPDWIDRHAEIPKSVIKGLTELGVMGMTVSKEVGGLGMSQYAYCKVAETLAGRCASTALFVSVHQSIGLKALVLFGNEKQRREWLGPLARAEKLAAFALTEPNAGSDASGVETHAVYDPEKKVYRINGRKQWITNGSLANVLTLMAKTEVQTPKGKQEKITAFLVPTNTPGFKVTAPGLEKVGMRGTRTANLEFTDMEIPEENVLGPMGGGLRVCLTVLDYGRTTFGAMCTGAAKFLIERAIRHARTRYQFKRPLASFGLVKKKIAHMAALTYAMDATTYLTAGLIDAGVEDIMLESAILKVFSSEALWEIIYETMQIYGGRSLFTDQPLERMLRDARLNMIGEGSNDVLRAFIAAVGLREIGLELKSVVEALKNPFKEYRTIGKIFSIAPNWLQRPKTPKVADALKAEIKMLSKAIHQFGGAIARLLLFYREGVAEKQLELERIADSATALYTMTAVLSRLDAALNGSLPTDHLEDDLAAGKFYCRLAMEKIDKNLRALFSKDKDEAIEKLSDQLTGVTQL